jgi:hypothetical protein
MLSRTEKVELGLIGVAIMTTAWLSAGLRWTPAFSTLVGYSAALLLGQGLVRDVARLVIRRRAAGGSRRIMCLCAESTIGLLLIGLAVGLTLLGLTETVAIGRIGLTLGLAAVLASGFVAKDYVLSIRKEKDHASVILW